jgi:hypothetical protein
MEVSMRKLGERGYSVMARYDPCRKENKWTVLISYGILTERQDTDAPNIVLDHFWSSHMFDPGLYCPEVQCLCDDEPTEVHKYLAEEEIRRIVLDVITEINRAMEVKYSRDYQKRGLDD